MGNGSLVAARRNEKRLTPRASHRYGSQMRFSQRFLACFAIFGLTTMVAMPGAEAAYVAAQNAGSGSSFALRMNYQIQQCGGDSYFDITSVWETWTRLQIGAHVDGGQLNVGSIGFTCSGSWRMDDRYNGNKGPRTYGRTYTFKPPSSWTYTNCLGLCGSGTPFGGATAANVKTWSSAPGGSGTFCTTVAVAGSTGCL